MGATCAVNAADGASSAFAQLYGLLPEPASFSLYSAWPCPLACKSSAFACEAESAAQHRLSWQQGNRRVALALSMGSQLVVTASHCGSLNFIMFLGSHMKTQVKALCPSKAQQHSTAGALC